MNLWQKTWENRIKQHTRTKKKKSSDEDLVLKTGLWVQSRDREGEFYLSTWFKLCHSWHVLGCHRQFVQFNSLCLVRQTTLDPERHIKRVRICCRYCCWEQMRHLPHTTAMISWCVLLIKVQKNRKKNKKQKWKGNANSVGYRRHTGHTHMPTGTSWQRRGWGMGAHLLK